MPGCNEFASRMAQEAFRQAGLDRLDLPKLARNRKELRARLAEIFLEVARQEKEGERPLEEYLGGWPQE